MSILEPNRSSALPVVLPDPVSTSDCTLFTALQNRKTVRDIKPDKLPRQVLGNLLWAGFGVNRRAGPFDVSGRTAPSASNSQEVDIYVAMENGAYLYDAEHHRLLQVTSDDLREDSLTPGQHSIDAEAPVTLIYVVDMNRLEYTRGYKEPGLRDPEVQKSYYFVDTGAIAANVYLFAAAEGLAAWFHNCNRDSLSRRLHLRPQQRVLFSQSVGYPDGG